MAHCHGLPARSRCAGSGANLPALYNTYEYAKETDRGASELGASAESDNATQEAESAKAPTGGMDYNQIVAWSYTPSESLIAACTEY